MHLKEVLKGKSNQVFTIQPQQTLKEALTLLTHKHIGALLVCDVKMELGGILSERDILLECHKNPKRWSSVLVEDVMTPNLICVSPESNLEDVMELMTENRIRHLPVMNKSKLAGIVSIGDVVKALLEYSRDEVRHMKDYLLSA